MFFENKVFRKIFMSFSITNLGDWIDYFAIQTIFAYKWNASPMLMGFFTIAYLGPSILFGQVSGVLIDKFNKLKIVIVVYLLMGFLTLGIMVSTSAYMALLVLVIRSSLNSLDSVAQQSLLRNSVKEDEILKATTMNSIVFQITRVVGPLLGAFLVSKSSSNICLIINAISFFVAAIMLITLLSNKRIQENEESTKSKGIYSNYLEGWKMLIHNKNIVTSMGIFMLGLCFVMVAESQTSILLRDNLHVSETFLGEIMGVVGIGSVIVGGILMSLKSISNYPLLIGSGALSLGLGYLGMGMYTNNLPISLLFLAAFLQGIGIGMVMLTYTYILQKESPKNMIGRVSGINMSLQGLVQIIGPLVGGLLVSFNDVTFVYKYMGLLIGIFGIVIFVLKKHLFDIKTYKNNWSKEEKISESK